MAIEHTFIARDYDGGVAYAVPNDVVLPTAVGTLPPQIKAGHLGTLAQDGLTIAETRESETVPDFNGDDYVTFQKKYSVEVKFKLLDVDKEQVQDLLNGVQNITRTPANGSHGNLTTIDHTGEQLPLQGFVLTTKSGEKIRFDTLQDARVSEVAEFKLESQNVSGVEVTVKGTKDGAGRLFRTFIDDGKIVPGPVTVTITVTGTDGTWRVGHGGHWSAPIDHDAANPAVKAAIEAIYGFDGSVTVTGSAGEYTIAYPGGGVFTVDGSDLVGGTAVIA